MRKYGCLVLVLCLLTACTPLLEREYATIEPHSSRFWESEAAGTLRAENYQDIVNDLLILIGQHTETAVLWLYNVEDDLTAADTLERAAIEVQHETPLGAYAVEYITYTSQAQRGYYEVALQLGYRRTAEQIQSLVSATSPSALASLLETALNEERTELAVRLGYWGEDGQAQVEDAVARVRELWDLEDTPPWQVLYYPSDGPVGLIEFLLEGGEFPDPPPEDASNEDAPEDGTAPEEDMIPEEAVISEDEVILEEEKSENLTPEA